MDGYARVQHAVIEELTGSKRHHAALVVYLAILTRVRYSKPGRRGGIDLDIGQAVLGQRELGAQLDLDRKVIRTALAKLEARGLIAMDERTEGTIVTVLSLISTANPQRDGTFSGPLMGPSEGPTAGPHHARSNYPNPQPNSATRSVDAARMEAHEKARHEDIDGPTTGPRRAPNEEDQTLSLGSESSPSGLPDPGTSVRADLGAPPPAEPPPYLATEMPPGWAPEPAPELDREAAKLGVDVNLELVKLRAAGERRVDWQQRWRMWLGHAITFARKQQPAAPNPDRAARAAAERRAAEERESAERTRRDAKAVADRGEVAKQAQLALATLRGVG